MKTFSIRPPAGQHITLTIDYKEISNILGGFSHRDAVCDCGVWRYA